MVITYLCMYVHVHVHCIFSEAEVIILVHVRVYTRTCIYTVYRLDKARHSGCFCNSPFHVKR